MIPHEDSRRSWDVRTDNNGGQVIAGINSKAFPHDFASIIAIPQEARGAAIQMFYLSRFWTPMKLGGLESQDLANQVFDQAVNSGSVKAIKLLQRACNALRQNVEVDGAIGPMTLAAANAPDPDSIVAAYRIERQTFYRTLAEINPADQPYLEGWIKRTEG